MAVFTEVSFDEAGAFLSSLNLGQLQSIKGAAAGIENTNYFVNTVKGQYVLTLFERLSFEQLPFYLYLMKHLAGHGIPVPDPVADAMGNVLHRLKGKPAAVVNKLSGHNELAPSQAHCAGVGEMLARMHLAGLDYPRQQPNLRGLSWWNDTVPLVLPHLTPAQQSLILGELAYQNHVAESAAYRSLPRGAIHADLFRDNVMFENHRLTGFFDFYFAGYDTFLFDIGICLNDWCIDLETGALDAARADAFMAAYQRVRPVTAQERSLLPSQQRAGALRFWISRLWDFHLPREATVLKAHDPGHFERVLRQRLDHPYTLQFC
ncbi:MAG: homoserine kinase [Polaromonas sp.]